MALNFDLGCCGGGTCTHIQRVAFKQRRQIAPNKVIGARPIIRSEKKTGKKR
jgi:hypothetical protein